MAELTQRLLDKRDEEDVETGPENRCSSLSRLSKTEEECFIYTFIFTDHQSFTYRKVFLLALIDASLFCLLYISLAMLGLWIQESAQCDAKIGLISAGLGLAVSGMYHCWPAFGCQKVFTAILMAFNSVLVGIFVCIAFIH